MRILFDLAASQPKGSIKFHGGSEYSKIIFREIVKTDRNIVLEAFYDKNREYDESIVDLCKAKEILLHYIDVKCELNGLILCNQYDIVYSALPGSEYVNVTFPSKTKFVFTQHGLRGLELLSDKYEGHYIKNKAGLLKYYVKRFMPNYVQQKRWRDVKSIFSLTDNMHIITDSYHSKSSILWYFSELCEEQITVAAAPAKKVTLENKLSEKEFLISHGIETKKFFLLVSGDRWEKNNYRMIIALTRLLKKKSNLLKDYKVLVLGDKDGSIYQKLITKELEKYFIFEDYVTSEQLEILYKNAYAFLYPSLNEGFGYPPIEVMKYGTLAVCAADSSITEVCGDAVLYFNPLNINEMVIRLLQCLDPEVKEQLKCKMSEHYKEISGVQKLAIDRVIKAICS